LNQRRQARRSTTRRQARVQPPRAAPAPVRRRTEILATINGDQDVELLRRNGFVVVTRSRVSILDADLVRLQAPGNLSLSRAIARLRTLLPQAVVDRNLVYRTGRFNCSTADCPKFDMVGWVKPPASCPLERTIGLIDTGIDLRHPSLDPAQMQQLTSRSPDRPESSKRHGTAVAALLIGRDNSPTPGLLPKSRIVAVDAFHNAGGDDVADGHDLVKAIDLLDEQNVRLVNMSIAGPDNAVLSRAILATRNRGTIIVAAAGNEGPKAPPAYPAGYEGVVAVTAVDARERIFRRANTGRYVSFAAPGVDVVTATPAGAERVRSGTSFAAPFVTAAIAVQQDNPIPTRQTALNTVQAQTPSAGSVLEALSKSVKDLGAPGRDPVYGHGLLQAAALCR
jgi:hypothetical protein